MISAVGYVRRSAASTQGVTSLQVQQSAIADYCESKSFDLQEVVRHDGISGTKRKRFADITSALDKCKASVLVVYNLDRLARDAAGLSDYIKSLTSRGVVLHEVGSGPVDTKRALGRLVTGVRGVMDEFYAGVISEKTTDALAALRSAGRRYSRLPPLGWAYIDRCLVVEPEEQRGLEIIRACRREGLGRVRTLGRLISAHYTGRQSLGVIEKVLRSHDGD